MVKKSIAILLAMTMIATCCFATAEGTDNSTGSGWGFGDSSFGNLQMPEMPSMNQEDWWGNFEAPSGWGEFSFGDFSTPANGSWGDLGSGMDSMSSAFDDFKNSTLNGLGKDTNLPSTGDANSSMEDAFNQQKDSVMNGMTQPSTDVQSLYGSVFGSDKEYHALGQVELPITFDQLKAKNSNLPSMDTSSYNQIKSIASTTKINSIMGKAASAPDASLSNLPTLTIGESADQHNFTGGDLSSKYSSYSSGLSSKLTFKPTESEYKGLYNSQKASMK